MSLSRSLLRGRGSHDSGKVGMVELFFDLVFVFAVTQLSHSLLANLTNRLNHLFSALVLGALTTAVIMLVAAWETIALRESLATPEH